MFLRLQRYDIEIQYKRGSEMYLADTLRKHFSGDKVQLIRSHFEEEIEKVPQIEEINQIVASEEMSRLRVKPTKIKPYKP